jgi:amino acid transporter
VAEAVVEERQLLKAMRWYDGFVVALANPGFLIGFLGYSIGTLGGWGAVVLWSISMTIGALSNWVYSESAAMFPDKPGGIALYAHEGWRKYFSLVGPVATFGYWFAWSSVLAIFGLTVGSLIQAEWFSGETWTFSTGLADNIGLGHVIGAVLIVIVWLINIYGIRPAVWLAYVTGAMLMIPLAVFIIGPYITGDWHSANMDWTVGDWKTAVVWLYLMGWSAYGVETCAAFAPEYKDTIRDTTLALRSAALFSLAVYALLPLGLGGVLPQDVVAADPVAFYVPAFDEINNLAILFAGNLGYMAAHFFALTGFILLRMSRPRWPRPIKLPSFWVPLAGLLAAANGFFIIIGASNPSYAGYGGQKETWIGVAVLLLGIVLFLFRRIVQDRAKVSLREEVPEAPPTSATTTTSATT